jgi:hypothetical protein
MTLTIVLCSNADNKYKDTGTQILISLFPGKR